MKKIRNILIILSVIEIVILMYLLIVPPIEEYDYASYVVQQEDILREKGELDESNYIKAVRDEIIQFENQSILSNYEGELTTGSVNVKFTDLLNGGFEKIYKDTKGMDEQALVSYLNSNSKDIAMQTGIKTLDQFKSFIEKIKVYKDDVTCTKAEIVENSYVSGENYNDIYDKFLVQLTYDNGQVVVFNVLLSTKDFIETPLVIIY